MAGLETCKRGCSGEQVRTKKQGGEQLTFQKLPVIFLEQWLHDACGLPQSPPYPHQYSFHFSESLLVLLSRNEKSPDQYGIALE